MNYDGWTASFANYNIRSFQTCGFDIPETYLEMYVYIKEIIIPPGKKKITGFFQKKSFNPQLVRISILLKLALDFHQSILP